MWSGHTSASTIATCLNSQSFLRIFPISILFCPKNSFLRYFGANTIWYLQFQHVCAKLKLSIDIYLLSNSSVGPHEYCKEISFSGKTISSTSTPDYLGVLTRSAFAGLAQTITIHQTIWWFFMDGQILALYYQPPSSRANNGPSLAFVLATRKRVFVEIDCQLDNRFVFF